MVVLKRLQAVPSESQDMDVTREEYHNSIGEINEDQGDLESRDAFADEEVPLGAEQLVTPSEANNWENYGRHALLDFIDLDDSNILPESRDAIEGILSNAAARERTGELETDGDDISMLEALERVVATRTNHNSREAAAFIREANRRSTFRLSDGSGEGVSERGAESSGEDGDEPCPTTIPGSNLDWTLPGARHPSPICYEKGYREFMITMLPELQVLDNVAVTENERVKARCLFEERFEPIANKRKVKESVLQVLEFYLEPELKEYLQNVRTL